MPSDVAIIARGYSKQVRPSPLRPASRSPVRRFTCLVAQPTRWETVTACVPERRFTYQRYQESKGPSSPHLPTSVPAIDDCASLVRADTPTHEGAD